MLERDVDAIRAAAVAIANTDGVETLYETVARFAVTAFAPTQHARHALTAALAVGDLRSELGASFVEAVSACAVYVAQSRLPWSEPPILEPPALGEGQRGDIEEIRAAVSEKDRLRAERWLASRIPDSELARDYFKIACDDFADLGHRLIVSVCAWRLAPQLGDRGRYAALRIAAWEWCATDGEPSRRSFSGDRAALLSAIVERMESERGSLVSAHQLHIFDAALQAEHLGVDPTDIARALGAIDVTSAAPEVTRAGAGGVTHAPPPVYKYGLDLAGYLDGCAIAQRLSSAYGSTIAARIRTSTHDNLMHGEELDAWSFA